MKCPDCFIKIVAKQRKNPVKILDVLVEHLQTDMCQNSTGPSLRKLGRPIKYHPIPSQKLTEDFELPPPPSPVMRPKFDRKAKEERKLYDINYIKMQKEEVTVIPSKADLVKEKNRMKVPGN